MCTSILLHMRRGSQARLPGRVSRCMLCCGQQGPVHAFKSMRVQTCVQVCARVWRAVLVPTPSTLCSSCPWPFPSCCTPFLCRCICHFPEIVQLAFSHHTPAPCTCPVYLGPVQFHSGTSCLPRPETICPIHSHIHIRPLPPLHSCSVCWSIPCSIIGLCTHVGWRWGWAGARHDTFLA